MILYYGIVLFVVPGCLANSIILNNEDETLCKFRKCVYKCCPENQYMNTSDPFIMNCVPKDTLNVPWEMDFRNISLFDNEYHQQPVNKFLDQEFFLKQNLYANETFASEAFWAFDFNKYLSESGVLYLEYPNAYKRWTRVETDFCIEYGSNGTALPEVNYLVIVPYEPSYSNSEYYYIGLIISSVFLTAVLIVYAILPELRNIGGMVLMAYVFSLLGAFLSLAAIQMDSFYKETCIVITTHIYFFFLSAFSWMNVMSFDIWWTFRGYAKARPIHRRGEKFKFCMYALYAWGVPTLMSIGLVVINNADLRDMPWFIKPQVPDFGCFLNDGQQLVYFYIPMLILILFNWMFYVMTAFNIWRLSRGTARAFNPEAAGNPLAHQRQKQRFMIYLKLSVIMGINWILEVGSSLKPDLSIWMITDFYNVFIGFTIFLIFICKKSIYNKLTIRCRGIKNYKFPKRTLTSSFTLESNLSQEAPPNVCADPKGDRRSQRKRSTEQRPTFDI